MKTTLPRYQINILLFSLKFTPTLKSNISIIQIQSDKNICIQKLCLAIFSQNVPGDNISQNVFKTKPNFTPPRNKDKDSDYKIDILNNKSWRNGDFSIFFVSFSVYLFFFIYHHPFSLSIVFILFHLKQMKFSQSTHLLMYLALGTLTSIKGFD